MTSISYFADFISSRTQISNQLWHFTAIKRFDYGENQQQTVELCVFRTYIQHLL